MIERVSCVNQMKIIPWEAIKKILAHAGGRANWRTQAVMLEQLLVLVPQCVCGHDGENPAVHLFSQDGEWPGSDIEQPQLAVAHRLKQFRQI